MSLAEIVLATADCKQLLGMRYAEWAIRAPSLEADIAAAAMGLDDIGHSRVLLGCLEPLGEDPRPPGRDSDPEAFLNVAFLDQPWQSWDQFVAANAVLDTAFTAMIQACVEGKAEVLRSRLRKMLMEERYHLLHGRSWLREGLDEGILDEAWREALEWFGPPEGEVATLQKSGALSMGPAELLALVEEKLETEAPRLEVDWTAWDPLRRRCRAGAMDARTFEMISGLEERRFMPAGGTSRAG